MDTAFRSDERFTQEEFFDWVHERPAAEINLGDVVRHTEDDLILVDCAACGITPACGVTGVLGEALAAFMTVLDRHTLADVTKKRRPLRALLTPAAAR